MKDIEFHQKFNIRTWQVSCSSGHLSRESGISERISDFAFGNLMILTCPSVLGANYACEETGMFRIISMETR